MDSDLEKRIEDIEDKIESLEAKIGEISVLDEEVQIGNGKEKPVKVREILRTLWEITELVRFSYSFLDLIRRHKILKVLFLIINISFLIFATGFALTGEGFLQLIGLF